MTIKLFDLIQEIIGMGNVDIVSSTPIKGTLTDEERKKRFYEEIYYPHIGHIKNVASKYVALASDKKHLVQDTLLKAYRNIHLFEKGTNAEAWLNILMRNLINNRHKALQTQKHRPLPSYTSDEFRTYNRESGYELEDTSYSDKTQTALDSLPSQIRKVFDLYIEDYPYEEIAQELNIPIGTVRSRIFRAKELLRGKLEPA